MSVIVNGREMAGGFAPVTDRGFTLGDGLFETIPLYRAKPFLLANHMERMQNGAAIIRLALPAGIDEVSAGISRLAEANNVGGGGVARLTVTRGSGPRGYGIEGCDKPMWTLTVERYEPMPDETRNRGLRLAVSRYTKNARSHLNVVKSTSALDRVMIVSEAKSAGADEALVLSSEGDVASCGAANIFRVKNKKLYTPPLSTGALPGVTRGIVIRIAAKCGIEAVEGLFKPSGFRESEEVFITNSLMEIVPVRTIDGLFESNSPFEVSRAIGKEYHHLTASS